MLSSTSPIDRPSLHPGTRYLIAPRVPHGLASVVEGLTREVLRHHPEDIYVFAAHHFEKLLKLREQYHAEEYSGREFDHEFGCEFRLWPTKKAKDIGRSSNSDWSLEKKIEIFERTGKERRGKVSADVEESTDVSTDRENRKTSKQTCSRSLSMTTKKTSKKSKDNETTSDIRATRIISQMSALHGKNIQTKDIKQELRRNKLSGEKAKRTDDTEKGIRNEKRSKMKISKTNKDPEEEVERATTTTTSSSRTSARRPLRKVRRIETESETETERETMTKTGRENGYERSNMKNNGASNETTARTGSRENRPKSRFSEHSSERKVSSRALSMDRIRAYVLRKFASTASLEVLRSPTYVEQVQEVIDRAAPIIKEKLEEVRGPRGKRSKSVDLAWNKDSFRQRIRDGKKYRDYEKEEESKRKTGNELPERKVDIIKKEETENSLSGDETISNVETEEKKSRRRSVGSGKKTRRRENGGHGDIGVMDQVDSKHNDKLEYESGATRDTLEAKLTATQNILEDISKSTYDLGGIRKNDPAGAGGELPESEVSDHANIVSLPSVRPPSSRNSRSATKNGSDNLTLPPISPEAPKSMKKKDELSLPVLPVVANGNHSGRKSQDAEEASTMHDITNDIEDIEIIPKDDYEEVIADVKQDSNSDLISSLVSDERFNDAEKREKDEDMNDVLLENNPEQFTEKRGSLEEFEELERKKMEEIFKDSLNVTPEVVNVSPRPDSLESDEEKRLQNDDVDFARVNTFDGLKDKLIEIEMAERNIEIALAGQQLAMHDDGEETSQMEKSMIDGKINDVGKSTNKVEETVSEVEKSADAEKISINKDDEGKERNDDEEEKNVTNEIAKVKNVIEISMNQKENLSNKTEKSKAEEKIERSSNEMENTTNEAETSVNEIEKSTNKMNEAEILKNELEMTTNHMEILTKAAEEAIKVPEDEQSMDKTERLMNEKLPIDVEKLTVKIHIENVQSINTKLQNKDDQITQVAICETDDDNVTASKNKADNIVNEFSKITVCGNAANESEISAINLPDENTRTKERKKREIDKLPAATSLSLELPFSYVLSEGSPCEIPDSVTTVIIPDRHCTSPVALKDENYQFGLTSQKEESFIRSNIAKKSETQENEHGMEIFGEYIRPEASVLPIDIDFVHGTKGIKSNQIVIAHQDLDRIKEEGEEEEKKDAEKGEIESPREQKDDKQPVIHEEVTKLAILEDIVEHEENETTNAKMTFKSKDAEEISSEVPEYESLPDTVGLMADIGLIDEENMNLMVESQNTIENSSEENGSTQDTRTITSSDVKESTASNRSIESPSLDRPVVPELNLDSLQDNTVSSFKMTANGTVTKEDNDSPRESDTTTSLIEPLISDERLMNQQALVDREENVAEELTESLSRHLQSEVPETDQLYRAEHAEYEWMEKDLLSLETNLEDEVKSQENSMVLPEDVVLIGPLLRDEEKKKLENEEEIARELIGSLEEDMQLYAKDLVLEEKSKDSGEPEKSNSSVNDKSNRSLSESVDEQEKRECEISSEEIQTLDKDAKAEVINELSSQMADIKQDHKDKNIVIIGNELEELKLEVEEKDCVEIRHVAPLAQFEQDELLELNGAQTIEKNEEKITVENKLDIIDTVSINNKENLEDKQTSVEEVIESQSNESTNKDEEKITVETKLDIIDTASINNKENLEDKQISVEEVIESQSNESTNKIEELHEQQKKSEENIKDGKIEKDEEKITIKSKLDIIDMVSTNNQENLEDKQTSVEEVIESQNNESTNRIEELHEQQKESEENIQNKEECEKEKLKIEEKREQKEIEIHEECQQEKSEKYTQEDLKIQEKNDYENLQLQEKIVDMKTVPLETTESRKGLMNESTNDDDDHGETNDKLITCDGFVTDDSIEKDVKNNEIEKHKDLSTKIEDVHKPIASVISEQSTKDHFHGGYWITETKSSTVETVIETSDLNANIDEGMEPAADVPEIIKDGSLIQKKDDFYLAVVKIQACFRGFLTRRRMKEDVNSKSVSNNVSSAQKTDTNDHLTVPHPSSLREARTGRQRLRREEALRNTTLSLENAFATGRLQHTGEFHDSVPLPLFDSIYRKANSTTDEFLNKTIQEDVEQTNQSDTAKSNANKSDSVHDDEHGGSFEKGNVFTDHSTFPIVMHLLADASRNRRFTVNQNSHSDFDTNAGGVKPKEPTLTDILMLGYPRDDENRYLNFITSVEDLGSNMDSLSLDDTIKSSKNTDAHPSTTSGEGSLREPLALPGTPQGVVIEEVTSLNAELVPSESATKSSTASKTSLDTNSLVSSEECTLENEKKDLGTSPEIMEEMGDRKHMDGGTERQKSDCNLESIPENGSHSEDVKKESSEVSCDNHERVEEEKNEKT